MDAVITFLHEGKEYTADIISSDTLVPHYHWVLFRSPDMKARLGDDIAFVEKDNKIRPVNLVVAKKNRELYDDITTALQNQLKK